MDLKKKKKTNNIETCSPLKPFDLQNFLLSTITVAWNEIITSLWTHFENYCFQHEEIERIRKEIEDEKLLYNNYYLRSEHTLEDASSRPILRGEEARINAGIGGKNAIVRDAKLASKRRRRRRRNLSCLDGVAASLLPLPRSKDDAVVLITRMKVRPSYARSPL